MRLSNFIPLVCILAGLSCGTGEAAVLLLENFNSPTGQTQNDFQFTTGFPVAFGGSYAGWTASGTSAIHMVNRNSTSNWAPMLWSAASAPNINIITSPAVAAGNSLAHLYSVTFDLAPAVYAMASQAAIAGDGVMVEVLNSSNAVITSKTFFPGAFASQAAAGSLPYNPVTLYYLGTGAGTGAASLRFSPTSGGTQRFPASIDNVALNTLASLPSGTVLFSENFNDPTGLGASSTQATTGFTIFALGNLAYWTKAGDQAVHFVDRGGGDLAAMFFSGQTGAGSFNVITTTAIGVGNLAGVPYELSFDLATAVYNNLGQATTAADGIVVDILDSTGAIIDTETFLPGVFTSEAAAGVLPFESISMLYTGTGAGDGSVRLRLSANNGGTARFTASIDNLQLATLALAVPEPGSLTIVAVVGLVGLLAIKPLVRQRKTS